MINEYFLKIRNKLEEISWLIIEQQVNFDLVSKDLEIIEGKLVFLDNSILEFIELINDTGEYRFNYMDKDKNLIFRWDTAPHHKEISPFPYHLHTKEGIEKSKEMNLIEVLDIIIERIINNLIPDK